MTDDELRLWARITFLQSVIEGILVGQFRGESDPKAAVDAARHHIKARAHHVHLPAHFHGLEREQLATEVTHAIDQTFDEISAQLD